MQPKDRAINDSEIFIVGANGQLGQALQAKYPSARKADIDELDITDAASVNAYDWSGIKYVINAAAFTNVDGAETLSGRGAAWLVNAHAVKNLTYAFWKNKLNAIVHISTDYVFDGTQTPHKENEPFSPLSVYGASKAAGDLLVSQVDKHYILRTSWVIGAGNNFVRTMLELRKNGVSPTVVHDQVGRLTFTRQLVDAIDHLLTTKVAFGTYNISNSGDSVSWAGITREVYRLADYTGLSVSNTTTEEYFKGKDGIAPRPLQSTLDLSKIEATGLKTTDWRSDLADYIKAELAK